MRLILAIVLGLAATATAASADAVIRYTLAPVFESRGLTALRVEIQFDGEDDGDTVLNLPNEWGGKSKLYEGVRDLKIAGGDVVAVNDPAKRIVRHRPRAKIFVSYRVVQNWQGEPTADHGNEYRLIIQPTYFHVLGNAIFIAPESEDNAAVSFELKPLPRGWTFASDLEHATMGRKLSMQDIIESVSVGGDFRVLKRGFVRVALRGKWSFSDESFVDRLQPIIQSHHRFWNDPEQPFLVTALPLASEPGTTSLGGTGRDDAFAFFATNNAEDALLNRLLAHEHLHTWIPRRIGRLPEHDEAADYWLSEGFTDFYTTRLLVRDGIWTLSEFTEALNELLRTYAHSAVRTAPNAVIVKNFWNDPETGQLPYQRGQLLAVLWDQRLRETSEGTRDLDDVMLAMKRRVQTAEHSPLASVLFAEEMQKAGYPVTAEIARYARDGEGILLPQSVFEPCGEIDTVEMPEFDRGFDADKTAQNGNIIVGLGSDTPGYRAGLRNGMKILKREAGKPGDSRVALTYRVIDGGVERVITYLPEGRKRITLQELVLETDMDQTERKDCVSRISGLSGKVSTSFWSDLFQVFSTGRR